MQGRNSRPLPHIFTRLLALHSQISSPITCRHTAQRSDPYHDQSARAILGTVQHLYPLELSCDRENVQTPPQLNPEAPTFRPRRDAAVAAPHRIHTLILIRDI